VCHKFISLLHSMYVPNMLLELSLYSQDSYCTPRIPIVLPGFPSYSRDSHCTPGIPTVLPGFPPYSRDSHCTPGIFTGFLGIRNPKNPPFPPWFYLSGWLKLKKDFHPNIWCTLHEFTLIKKFIPRDVDSTQNPCHLMFS